MISSWIPVTERLPPPGEDLVLIRTHPGAEEFVIGYHDAEDGWFSELVDPLRCVTHWQPLEFEPASELMANVLREVGDPES